MKTFIQFVIVMSFGVIMSCTAPKDSSTDGNGETPRSEEKTIEEMREEAWAQIDQAACEADGGTVRQAGMLGLPRCIIPYSDAGNICSDASDCEGRCLGSDDVTDYNAAPGDVLGRCEADDSPFGCYAEIKDGTSQGAICVD